MIEELEKRTRLYFEIEEGEDNPHSNLDYVVAQTEQGTTLTELAEDISGSIKVEIGRELISSYLRSTFDDTEIRLTEARALASHALVEQAIKLVDQPAYTTVSVSRAASRARTRQWTAERWNAKELGQSKQQGITLNIGTLHLDALRAPNHATQARAFVSDTPEGRDAVASS